MIKLKLPYDVGLLAKLRRVDRVDVWLDAIRVAAGQFLCMNVYCRPIIITTMPMWHSLLEI